MKTDNILTAKQLANRLNSISKSPGVMFKGLRVTNIGHYFVEPGSPTKGISWKLSRVKDELGGRETVLVSKTCPELCTKLRVMVSGFIPEPVDIIH